MAKKPMRAWTWLLCTLCIFALLVTSSARAHPMSLGFLVVRFEPNGTYVAELTLDSVRFSKRAQRLERTEQQRLLSSRIRRMLTFEFDDEKARYDVQVRSLGDPDESGQAGVDVFELGGKTPKKARTFQVVGSRELGALGLTIEHFEQPTIRFMMRAGYGSYPYFLKEAPPPNAKIRQGLSGDPIFIGPHPLERIVPGEDVDAAASDATARDPAKDGAKGMVADDAAASDGMGPGGEDQTPPSWTKTAFNYVVLGFEHILPLGLDHILFVLGLFLLSDRLKPLVLQLTTFTLAHSVTLALTALGWIRLDAAIVEPLIALSIAYVGIENLILRRMRPWRLLIVFAFGLLHGMGFAGALAELGLPQDRLMTGLVAFNVGVELGQLAVVLIAMLLVMRIRKRDDYQRWVVVPGSIAIAIAGTYWLVERTVLG